MHKSVGWWDGSEPDDDYDERREINEREIRHEPCDWCGHVHCQCDDSLFDADELGLDPEYDRGES